MEKNLKEIELSFLFRPLLDNFPGGVYWKDNFGVFLGCNLFQSKVFGLYSPDNIVGKTNADFFSAENIESLLELETQLLSKGKAIAIKEPLTKFQNANERLLTAKKLPILNNENKVVGILSMTLENNDEEKSAALNTILSLLPGNIYWKDREGRFLGSNIAQAKAIGYDSPDMLLGKTAFDTLPKQQAEQIMKTDEDIMCTGKAVSIEEVNDGETLPRASLYCCRCRKRI